MNFDIEKIATIAIDFVNKFWNSKQTWLENIAVIALDFVNLTPELFQSIELAV